MGRRFAAGLQVGFGAHAASDPSLAVVCDVYVGKVRAPAPPTPLPTPENPIRLRPPLRLSTRGTATNSGAIEASRGNVAIAGRTVAATRRRQSSTSVSLNGRIDLLASYNTTSPVVLGAARFAPGATGSVTLGHGSVTTIVPEIFSDETIAATESPSLPRSTSKAGRSTCSGSPIFAPSADVTLRAGTWLPLNGATSFIATRGQIYFDASATISVAGTQDVVAALSQNILSLELRGTELADSPTQRDGVLRGLTLNVDIRQDRQLQRAVLGWHTAR